MSQRIEKCAHKYGKDACSTTCLNEEIPPTIIDRFVLVTEEKKVVDSEPSTEELEQLLAGLKFPATRNICGEVKELGPTPRRDEDAKSIVALVDHIRHLVPPRPYEFSIKRMELHKPTDAYSLEIVIYTHSDELIPPSELWLDHQPIPAWNLPREVFRDYLKDPSKPTTPQLSFHTFHFQLNECELRYAGVGAAQIPRHDVNWRIPVMDRMAKNALQKLIKEDAYRVIIKASTHDDNLGMEVVSRSQLEKQWDEALVAELFEHNDGPMNADVLCQRFCGWVDRNPLPWI